MITVEEALERILKHFQVLEAEVKPILEALGQVLAEDIYAPFDVPPLDNSAMDGYAVQAESIRGAREESPVILEVTDQVAAGYISRKGVRPGTAIRIMTGAPIPKGADTVVPFEETDELARRASGLSSQELTRIGVLRAFPLGANVRKAGEDIPKGALILGAGTILRSAEVGIMATLGLDKVSVIRRPRVAILATGDELAEPGEPLRPSQIYNSNSYTIAAQVLQCGGIPKILGIARDKIADLVDKIGQGLDADMFITSAGVSTGEYDLVKDLLTQRGEMEFWRVRMRPGKPLAFGALRAPHGRTVPHLGLPGNPVSSMIAFDQFARPAIFKMMGRKSWTRPTIRGTLEEPVRNEDGRRFFARAVISRKEGRYYARLTGPQGSHILTSMAAANALVIVPEEVTSVPAGGEVEIQILEGYEELLS